MKKRMNTIHNRVLTILENKSFTRDSDHYLYQEYIKTVDPNLLNKPFGELNMAYKAYGLPDIESVGRARRKIQSEREDLRSSKEVDDMKYEKFKEMKEYATT